MARVWRLDRLSFSSRLVCGYGLFPTFLPFLALNVVLDVCWTLLGFRRRVQCREEPVGRDNHVWYLFCEIDFHSLGKVDWRAS